MICIVYILNAFMIHCILYIDIYLYIYIDIIPLSFRYLSIEFNMITLL